MNRMLIRGLPRQATKRFPALSSNNKFTVNKQFTRSVASNTNSGTDSTDKVVKAILTLEDGSVFEG